jgi:hypothetical protein
MIISTDKTDGCQRCLTVGSLADARKSFDTPPTRTVSDDGEYRTLEYKCEVCGYKWATTWLIDWSKFV